MPNLRCPECKESMNKVIDSRTKTSGKRAYIHRRRECLNCFYRFSTSETLDDDTIGGPCCKRYIKVLIDHLNDYLNDKLKSQLIEDIVNTKEQNEIY